VKIVDESDFKLILNCLKKRWTANSFSNQLKFSFYLMHCKS